MPALLAHLVRGEVVINGRAFPLHEIHDPAFQPPGHVATVFWRSSSIPMPGRPSAKRDTRRRRQRHPRGYSEEEIQTLLDIAGEYDPTPAAADWPEIVERMAAQGFPRRSVPALKTRFYQLREVA